MVQLYIRVSLCVFLAAQAVLFLYLVAEAVRDPPQKAPGGVGVFCALMFALNLLSALAVWGL